MRQLAPQTYKKTRRIEELSDDNYVTQTGLIAQEVAAIPELAHCVSQTPHDLFALDYNGVFTYALAAIKELDAKVAALEARLGDSA